MKGAASGVWFARFLSGEMRCYALNVLHDGDGIVKDATVDVLQYIAVRRARRLAGDEKSVIDVAAAMRRKAQDLAAEFKFARCGLSVGPFAYDHRLSG